MENSLVNIYGDLIGSLVKFQTVGSTIDFRSSFPPVKWENKQLFNLRLDASRRSLQTNLDPLSLIRSRDREILSSWKREMAKYINFL